jgi:hypothetical protein
VPDDGGANLNLLAPSLSGDGQFVAYVDNVSSGGDGSVTAGQVIVAPVELDTLVTTPEPAVA